MTVTLIPDAERLVGDYLRAHAAIVALDARVAGQIPQTLTRPWIRVTQIDAADASRPVEHLIAYLLQLDCYAGSDPQTGQAQAVELGRTARGVLRDLQGQVIGGATVTSVLFTSHARIPDDTFEPARERVVLDVELRIHA